MKQNLFRAVTLVFVLTPLCHLVIAQSSIEIQDQATYKLSSVLTTIKKWDGSKGVKPYLKICKDSKIKILGLFGDSVHFEVKRYYSYDGACTSDTNKDDSYVVDKATLEKNIYIPSVLPLIGVLTVPFKYEFPSSRLFPGGQIGFIAGVQRRINWDPKTATSWFVGGTAGYSRIALNSTNIQTPQTATSFADAFSYGLAGGITINGFQIMLTRGVDKYSVDGNKQKLNWYMLGVGYAFIKPATEK